MIFVIKNYSTALHCLLWAAGLNLLYIKITVQLNLALNWQHDFTQSDDQEAKYLNVTYTTEHTATAIKVLFSLDFQTFASSSRFTFFFIFSTRPVIFCFLSSLFRLRSSVALLRRQDKDSCLYLSKGKESLFYAGTLK